MWLSPMKQAMQMHHDGPDFVSYAGADGGKSPCRKCLDAGKVFCINHSTC